MHTIVNIERTKQKVTRAKADKVITLITVKATLTGAEAINKN